MDFILSAYTDAGISRANNQDSLCVRRATLSSGGEIMMAAVCDGMGGLKKGELASAATVESFGKWFDDTMPQLPHLCAEDFHEIRRQWEKLIRNIHNRLSAYGRRTGTRLGTTLSALLAYNDRYLSATVGDSRIYEVNDEVRQLTRDQSLVELEIEAGRITEDEARHHPQRNILLQCIGDDPPVVPAFTEGRLLGGAIYLICSDGFVHEVPKAELAEKMDPLCLHTKEKISEAIVSLVEVCKERGEQDNITVVAFKAAESQYGQAKKNLFSNLLRKLRADHSEEKSVLVTLVETAMVVHTDERIP